MTRYTLIAVLALFGLPTVGLGQGQDEVKTVVVASKNFTENRLLGEIFAQLIEARTDIQVFRKLNLGSSAIVYEALKRGDIDIYPEYTGTAWEEYLKIDTKPDDPLKTYVIVSEVMQREMGIRWLMPLGFENSFALAMQEDKAEELGIQSISELQYHDKDLVVRVSSDFFQRNDGWRPLTEYYELDISDVAPMEHGLAYQAIESGKVDVIDVWTTDGKLARMKLRLLNDDLGFFPPYQCVPVVREEVLEAYPELEEVLNLLAFKIDNEVMQELNSRVEELREDGTSESFAEVAHSFLKSEGLIDEEVEVPYGTVGRMDSFWSFMVVRAKPTLRLAGEHLLLTGIAVLLAIVFAVPTGIMLAHHQKWASPVLAVVGVIQTIPSLALLMFMIPFLGLGLNAAIAALFLYALLPILRNTYTGITQIDNDLLEAAEAIGMTKRQILFKVELPLATRTIMAGIRTSTIISIGVATLAAFIGAGGLGVPIVTGLQLNDQNWILSGAIPAALMAVSVDYLLGVLEKLAQPKGLTAST